jgi:hypothetical protein
MSSIQHRGVCDIEMIASFFKISSSFFSFFLTSFIQWYIDPAAKFALFVPNRLSMSDKDYFVCPFWSFFNKGLFFLKLLFLTNESVGAYDRFFNLSRQERVELLLNVIRVIVLKDIVIVLNAVHKFANIFFNISLIS